jgi:acyl-CoA synthetase (AMP-forming)/AMP-acid ligase II
MTIDYLPWDRPVMLADRLCMRDSQAELTYAEVARRVDAVAGQFAAAGVRRGDVVAVMLPNRVELLLALLAAWRLGAAATPVNPVFTPNEAGYQIADSGAKLLIATAPDASYGVPALAADDLATESAGMLPAPDTRPGDLALLIYTSGSAGRPKGVMLDHANLVAMGASLGKAMMLSPDDSCLLVLPLFHVNAILRGYLNRPEATAEAIVDGWLHTGDVGVLDADGYLTIVDRIKDMIIRGGENICPQEIESVLARHDAVLEAAVIGAPHEVYGEVPVAYLATYPGATVTAGELLALCRGNLTKIKIPVAVNIVRALPKNPVGKTDKPALRASHR